MSERITFDYVVLPDLTITQLDENNCFFLRY